jgi:hypothetical protein
MRGVVKGMFVYVSSSVWHSGRLVDLEVVVDVCERKRERK